MKRSISLSLNVCVHGSVSLTNTMTKFMLAEESKPLRTLYDKCLLPPLGPPAIYYHCHSELPHTLILYSSK